MRIVIIGAGSLGSRVAHLLVGRGHEVVVVESDERIAEALSESLDCGVIRGDGARPAVLGETDPEHADALLVLTGDAQTNLIASLVGRSVGFTRVITRIDDEEFEHVTLELGLSDTVVPARTIGRHLADMVEGQDVLELSGAIKGAARVFRFIAQKQDEGTVDELALPASARVSHVYRAGELVLTDADLALREDDEVVVICHRDVLGDLHARWAPDPQGDAR